MNNGKSASLPEDDHKRPPVLTGFRVMHTNEKGTERAAYDFAKLPVPQQLQMELASLMAEQVRSGGPWRNIPTSKQGFWAMRTFARWLARQDVVVSCIAELDVVTWKKWRMSLPGTVSGRRALRINRMLLLKHPELDSDLIREISKRVPADQQAEPSYDDAEMRRIASTARGVFRRAETRIKSNLRHLKEFRAGTFAEGSSPYLIGEALDVLAETGDVPRYTYRSAGRLIIGKYAKAMGGAGAEVTWQRLFLARHEAVAIAILLACEHGWNFTSIDELRVPNETTVTGGEPVYRVELEKRRRRPPHRYETRTFSDDGPKSAGRFFTRIMTITEPARELRRTNDSPTDRLILSHSSWLSSKKPTELIQEGVGGKGAMSTWTTVTGVRVNFRRIRKAVNVRYKREPNQNTRNTHDSSYVLTDPQTFLDSEEIIAKGIGRAISHAESVHIDVSRTNSDRGEETPTAACVDILHSPHSPWGVPCTASFLLCLACSNAVVMPKHLGRLAFLYECLHELKGSVSPERWGRDWLAHFNRLHYLRTETYTEAQWTNALQDLSPDDKHLIERLLEGNLDV